MKHERLRPAHVDRAVKSGDAEAIQALASAGGKANAKRWDEKAAWRDMEAEMHAKSMADTAEARNDVDDLLPADH